ncbi:aspartate aminotransferase family protein [Caballeronia sordidicola]|uniref:aminotransferase family protein n=1 Tax=Caballeronia sordidicola TaxID=196367 RepID=UPI00068D2746|nr:aminotransferase class III-fold pyridoxal phosphate-dependent enzyme [Caballeronia sordidicola]
MTTATIEDLKALDRKYIMHPFSSLQSQPRKDVNVMTSTNGIVLKNADGREFLDAGSGLWCANVGYGRTEIIKAATEQMEKTSFLHSFSNFSNEPLIRLSERLLEIAPDNMERVTYANSGSEANDTQIKLVWRYNNVRGKHEKKKLIARWGGYHGTTLGAGSVNGLSVVHRSFDLPIDRVLHTDAAEYHRRPAGIISEEHFSLYLANKLDKMIETEGSETVAAFIAEPIIGSAGVIPPPAGYFREIAKVLKKHDVLLIADEVITGFGRTGSWFAGPGLEMKPDLITVAKGLTSGYFPMSACLVSDAICEVLYNEKEADGFFGHGFTTSGHPVGAAVALANIDIIDKEGLLENSTRIGSYLLSSLREELDGVEFVSDIRGKGLMIGVEFDAVPEIRRAFSDIASVGGLLSQACLDEGLIVRGGHGRVIAAIAPPLTLTTEQADQIVLCVKRAAPKFAKALRAAQLDRA